jgi:4-hydroxy-tetrahydrodipicolinate reductase
MGKILIKEVLKNKNLVLHSVTDIKEKKIFNNIKTQKNNLEAFKKTDVIIDFSRPKSSLEIL